MGIYCIHVVYICIYFNLITSYQFIFHKKLNCKYKKFNINSYVDSSNNDKDVEDASLLWRDKVEYLDLSGSATTELVENGRSLPLFLLGTIVVLLAVCVQ